jgi:hypothetical protein
MSVQACSLDSFERENFGNYQELMGGLVSGDSSRKSPPLWAHEIAPGLATRWPPPPTMLATEAEWCGHYRAVC